MNKTRENLSPVSGDLLRDLAADLLSHSWGTPTIEKRVEGKKVDVWFEKLDMGSRAELFVECKDLSKKLGRSEIAAIWADYSGLLQRARSDAKLLVVTRQGLTTDAQAFIDEHSPLRHQSIFEIETRIFDFEKYWSSLIEKFSENNLDEYYIEQHANERFTGGKTNSNRIKIFDHLTDWTMTDTSVPIAILGGYGAGKSSLATRLACHQATATLKDPTIRSPILIRLGDLARRNDLRGLLGALFTAEHPIKGFGYDLFMKANRSGRYLIILDGFDEMKHAMPWAEFKSQVAELLPLTEGKSKVILLGRPSAFLSEDEERQILEGTFHDGESLHKLPGWPAFKQFELSPFTPSERAEFVRRYMKSVGKEATHDSIWLADRADQLNRIAENNSDVFSKPVHAKLLTDIAINPALDLNELEERISRWDLYNSFFWQLLFRETSKQARKDTDAQKRLSFLGELAVWLWRDKGGVTHFRLDDLPGSLTESYFEKGLPGEDPEQFLREYVVGSCLEKKAGNIFYFSHRSFAEFLVAKHIHSRPAKGHQHSTNSSLVADGVAQFLLETGPEADPNRTWIDGLKTAAGAITFDYVNYICHRVGGLENLKRLVGDSNPAWVLLRFADKNASSFSFDRKAILRNLPTTFRQDHFWQLCDAALSHRVAIHNDETWNVIAAALIERFWRPWISKIDDSVKARHIALRSCLSSLQTDSEGQYIVLVRANLHAEIGQLPLRLIPGETISVTLESMTKELRLRWQNVLEHISEDLRDKIDSHYSRKLQHPVLTISKRGGR